MASKNKNLNSAARDKNDEFYTQYSDIQRELNCYYLYDENFLRGKTLLLPCDDPEYSNFTKFFTMNFELYGLKKLISTSYAAEKKKFIYKPMRDLFDKDDTPQFDDAKDFSHGRIYQLDADDLSKVKYPLDALKHWEYLNGDGDFRSKECVALLKQSDIVVTNPPFSLFRQFVKQLIDNDKKFLIVGNINCITYKEIFPLIMQNKIWLGYGMGRAISGFIVPDTYELYGTEARVENGQRIVATNQCLWLTNIEHEKRNRPIDLVCSYEETPEKFPHYDNYDAIEVSKTLDIPEDYFDVMGVPITFLDKYCPAQFEILGHTSSNDLSPAVEALRTDPKNRNRGIINGKQKYDRILIRRRTNDN